MGSIVANLYGTDLVIFRAGDKDNKGSDIIFYIYKKDELFLDEEDEENKEIAVEAIIGNGIKIMTVKQLEKTILQKHRSLTQDIAEKTNGGEDLGYKIFSFLLLIKLAIKTLISYTYSKSLVELSQRIVGFEDEIAYNLAHYFLNELNYKVGFSDDILSKLEDKNHFTYYYKKLKEILKKEKDITKDVIDNAYDLFKEKVK